MSKFPPKTFQVSVNGFIWKQHTQKPTFLKTNKKKKSININKANLKREKEIRKRDMKEEVGVMVGGKKENLGAGGLVNV